MRSHELAKELLSKPDVELLLQTDPEGNGYETIRGVDFDVVVRIDNRETEVFASTSSAADNCMEEDEWEQLKETNGNAHAVVYP